MKKMWNFFMNLGCNMWEDKWSPPHQNPIQCDSPTRYYDVLPTERDTWRRIVDQLPSFGINALTIDIGEGMQYESHPELATEGAWTKEELRDEVRRIRALGMEPIPKLNLSACHDTWLGEYAHMLSTQKYYEVVRDVIREVAEVFEGPSLFHLGMDEEEFPDHHTGMTSIRSEDLWWHDVYFLFDEVTKHGARPWIWSDFYWKHQANWENKMPKLCVQSSWQYENLRPKGANGLYPQPGFQAYIDFARMGYDQIPIGTDWCFRQNFAQVVWFCLEEGIVDEHLLGFLAVPWQRTWDLNYYSIMNNAQRLKYARAMFEEYTPEKAAEMCAREVTARLS